MLRAKEIILAPDDRRGLPLHHLLECRLSGIRVIDYVAFWERETGRVDLDSLQPSWFILSDGFHMGPVSAFLKRAFDLLISSIILIAFLPVMVMAAIAIKLESPGPLLFRQERVGLRGRSSRCSSFAACASMPSATAPPVGAAERPAGDARGGVYPLGPHRRAAAALERPARRHELCRSAAGAALFRGATFPEHSRSIGNVMRSAQVSPAGPRSIIVTVHQSRMHATSSPMTFTT